MWRPARAIAQLVLPGLFKSKFYVTVNQIVTSSEVAICRDGYHANFQSFFLQKPKRKHVVFSNQQ